MDGMWTAEYRCRVKEICESRQQIKTPNIIINLKMLHTKTHKVVFDDMIKLSLLALFNIILSKDYLE